MSDEIICAQFDTPIGVMQAGATEKGCCYLEFEDRSGVERIQQRVGKRYRLAIRTGQHHWLDQLAAELRDYFERKRQSFDVPLDLRGTPFEMQVWRQLLAIPYGETRSYGEVAAALGRDGAQRAVGRANGANYLAIVVPCHRVIEANGKLRGYGGGLWRKEYLLGLERGAQQAALDDQHDDTTQAAVTHK